MSWKALVPIISGLTKFSGTIVYLDLGTGWICADGMRKSVDRE